MSWRPKEWKENRFIRVNVKVPHKMITPEMWDIFEQGADAMVETLFKLAEESPTKTFTIDSRVINIYNGG